MPDRLTPVIAEPAACELCGDQGPLLLHARCHLTAPLQAILDGNTLILRCYLPACGREVARFTVDRGGELTRQLQAAEQQLGEYWQRVKSCPCGARWHSPVTHPHVTGCPTARALQELLSERERQATP